MKDYKDLDYNISDKEHRINKIVYGTCFISSIVLLVILLLLF